MWEAGMQASQTLRHVSATSRSGSLQSLRESLMDEDRVSDIETVHAVCGPGLRMLTTGPRKWNRLSGLCPAAARDHSSPRGPYSGRLGQEIPLHLQLPSLLVEPGDQNSAVFGLLLPALAGYAGGALG